MSRDATAATITETSADISRPVVFVELDLAVGTIVRYNSTDRDLLFDSGSGVQTFTGAAELGSMSAVEETKDLQVTAIDLSLSGVNTANISLAFLPSHGRPGKIWYGFLDSTYSVIVDPALIYSGFIDNTSIRLGNSATVSIRINNRFSEWSKNKALRYTNEEQQILFPGDKFFEFIPQMVEKTLLWGVAGSTPAVDIPGATPPFRPASESGPGPTAPFGSQGTRPGGEFGPIDVATGIPVSRGEGGSGQGPQGGPGSGPGQSSGGRGGLGDTGSGGTV